MYCVYAETTLLPICSHVSSHWYWLKLLTNWKNISFLHFNSEFTILWKAATLSLYLALALIVQCYLLSRGWGKKGGNCVITQKMHIWPATKTNCNTDHFYVISLFVFVNEYNCKFKVVVIWNCKTYLSLTTDTYILCMKLKLHVLLNGLQLFFSLDLVYIKKQIAI